MGRDSDSAAGAIQGECVMFITTTETIRHFGAGKDNGSIPYKLEELINTLMQARMEIPQECWDGASVDCEPDYEFGEHYASMRITYERPMTPDEIVARNAENRRHWLGQLADAEKRIEYCNGQLAAL